jgi:hypothetical protein
MPHFRVDDALHSHPKAQRAGDEAMGMWARAGSFCMAYLTNGFVPEWWVKQQPKGVAKAKKLVEVGLWHDGAELDGEKGYQFHEFVGPGRQDSREKIEADRELARKRKQKSRGTSQQESHTESQRDTPCDERGESRRSPGYIPNPTQPNPVLPVVNSVGEGHESNARDPNAPPPRCPKHPSPDHDEPCRACKAVREHDEANAGQRAREAETRRRRERDHRRAAIRACRLCDLNGQITIPGPFDDRMVTNCPHDANEIQRAKTENLAIRAQAETR